MRIVYLINSLGTGGAETQVVTLCRELSKNHNICVVTLKKKPDSLLEQLEEIGVQYYTLDIHNPLSFLLSFKKLKLIVNKFGPDVIHAHLAISIIYSRLYRLLFRFTGALIGTAHSTNIGASWMGILLKLTDKFSDLNTNVSIAAVDNYTQKGFFSANKTIHMPNGFIIPEFKEENSFVRDKVRRNLGFNKNEFVCIAISRIAPVKNHQMMIEAMDIITKSHTNIRLLILGDGPDKGHIESLVENKRLTKFVSLIGNVDDIYPYAIASDCYVMTSIYEGMPLSICEAMIANLPVLTTNFNGVKEIVGEIYPIIEQNDHDTLAETIVEFSSKSCVAEIDIARRNIIDKFDIKLVCDRWLDLYKRFV